MKTNLIDKPKVGPDDFTVILSRDEMLNLTQVLQFSKEVFAEMAMNLQKEGNATGADAFNARSLLSQLLFNKFKTITIIGEPESRQVH